MYNVMSHNSALLLSFAIIILLTGISPKSLSTKFKGRMKIRRFYATTRTKRSLEANRV